jgi:hypothetical protein
VLDILVTVLIGFVLGFLIGLTGVGGGALVAPALYVILGTTYTGAVAMSLVYSVFTKIVGFVQHLRLGNIDWRLTLVYSLAAIPGAVIGAHALHAARDVERAFAIGMAMLLVAVALLILAEASIATLSNRDKPFDASRLGPGAIVVISIISFIVGVVLGITSVGSGSIIILSMVFLFRMPARRIVGSNIAIALVMVIPAGLTHVVIGGIDVRQLALLLAGSVVGTVIGSRGTTWLGDRQLKIVIALLVLVSAAATFLKAW